MALDTAISPLEGGKDASSKLEVYQRRVDFSVNNLDAADWFTLFTLNTGDVVVGGCAIINTAGTATATFTLGTASVEQLLGSSALDATAGTVYPFDMTAVQHIGADTVDIEMEVANAVLGVVDVTVLVLKAGDTAG